MLPDGQYGEFLFCEEIGYVVDVSQFHLVKRKMVGLGVLLQIRKPVSFELHIVIIVEVIHSCDDIAVSQKPPGQVIPDKTGGTGDEDFHLRSLLSSRTCFVKADMFS